MPKYPANILSNLNGNNGFTFTGLSPSTVPTTVAIDVGDMNGDGINDFAFGNALPATNLGSASDGDVVVFFGTATYSTTTSLGTLDGSNGFKVVGYARGSLGQSVKFIDVNQDGYQDLVIGAPEVTKATDRYDTTGFTYVIYGQGSGAYPAVFNVSTLNGANGFGIAGAAKNDIMGISLAGGDINNDGMQDIIIGANTKTYVIYGQTSPFSSYINTTNLNGANGFKVTGGGITFGAVDSADIDQDGIADMIMTQASTYVVFGRSTFPASLDVSSLDGQNGFRTTPINPKALLPFTAIAGDLNQDGYPDLFMGAPINGIPGKISVSFGHARPFSPVVDLSGLNGTNGMNFTGISNNDYMGAAQSNGYMGSQFVALTGSYYVNSFAGKVIGMYGSTLPFPSAIPLANITEACRGFVIDGLASKEVGMATYMADINGDGHDDIIIRSTDSAYVVLGKPPFIAIDLASTPLGYTENNVPLAVDSSLTVTVGDCDSVTGALVSIANVQANEILDFVDQNGITGQYDALTGILTLTGTASVANYQAALQSITYQNNNFSDISSREVSFVVSSGTESSTNSTRVIQLVQLNNLLSGTNNGLMCFNEGNDKAIFPQLTMAGGNTLTLQNALVTISNFVTAEDSLEFTDLGNNISGSFDSGTGILSLTGPATASEFEAVVQTIKYKNSNNVTSSSEKTFSVTVDYAGQTSTPLASQLNIITVNDAPQVINQLEVMNVTAGEPFTFTLSNNTFNGTGELTFGVTENDGSALTQLNYDAVTGDLNGTLPTVGQNSYSFFAQDKCGQNATTPLSINVLSKITPAIPSSFVQSPPSPESSSHTGAIVGGVVGGLAGLLCVGGIIGGLLWGKRQAEKEDALEMQAMGSDAAVGNNPAYQKKKSWYNSLYRSKSFKEAHSRDVGVDNSRTPEPKGP